MTLQLREIENGIWVNVGDGNIKHLAEQHQPVDHTYTVIHFIDSTALTVHEDAATVVELLEREESTIRSWGDNQPVRRAPMYEGTVPRD